VVVIDEMSFPKQGSTRWEWHHSTAARWARWASAQVGIFLAYVSLQDHTLLNRELNLPQVWTDDPAPDTPFATKPQQAGGLLEQVRDAGVPVAWMTGDTVYGRSLNRHCWLEDRDLHHMLWPCPATNRCGSAWTAEPRRWCMRSTRTNPTVVIHRMVACCHR